jgi:hypothetical protein
VFLPEDFCGTLADDARSHRVATAASRDHCTDTVISEPDAAVNCWSGCTTAALVIFTGKRPIALAWKVRVATTRDQRTLPLQSQIQSGNLQVVLCVGSQARPTAKRVSLTARFMLGEGFGHAYAVKRREIVIRGIEHKRVQLAAANADIAAGEQRQRHSVLKHETQ